MAETISLDIFATLGNMISDGAFAALGGEGAQMADGDTIEFAGQPSDVETAVETDVPAQNTGMNGPEEETLDITNLVTQGMEGLNTVINQLLPDQPELNPDQGTNVTLEQAERDKYGHCEVAEQRERDAYIGPQGGPSR